MSQQTRYFFNSKAVLSSTSGIFFRSSAGWIIVMIILWCIWLGYAQIPLSMTSRSAVVQSNQSITVDFGPQALSDLQLGQVGRIKLDDFQSSFENPLLVRIIRIDPVLRNGLTRVEMEFINLPSNLSLQRGIIGQVEVITRYQSPAALLWQFIAAPIP